MKNEEKISPSCSPTKQLIIVGTDTDAGKTIITAALARACFELGMPIRTIKPVQTGCSNGNAEPDAFIYKDACSHGEVSTIFKFKDACSPHLASGQEQCFLTAQEVAKATKQQILPQGITLIEGAGGVLTPLNNTETMLDAFALLGVQILLVVGNKLGCINHALLSVATLRGRGLHIMGFALCTTAQSNTSTLHHKIQNDNKITIARMTGLKCLAELHFESNLHSQDSLLRQEGWSVAAKSLRSLAQQLYTPFAKKENNSPTAILDFDQEHIWHPYTSAVSPTRMREVVSTHGTHIHLRNGKSLIDGMASWWSAIHGYNHPTLLQALHAQAQRMPHVMFGGLTHEPAVALARKLLGIAPANMQHVFFADSGSVAVEVAIKMAVQYQQGIGQPEKAIIMTVHGGYHGDTLGAMSVCDPTNGMHSHFKGILPQQLFAPRPTCRFNAPYDSTSTDAFEKILREHAHRVAAVIIEPIVQGAGAMWFYNPLYLRKIKELCAEHGILLILDEIATGFGRTGKMFACEWADIKPDIMCIGKALTGGVMSLAATLTTKAVAKGISHQGGVLMHGPTFMGNPLACAVAAANLDLLAENKWPSQIEQMEKSLQKGLEPCSKLPGVADVRILGGIGVVEMQQPVNANAIQDHTCGQWGVWLRPFSKWIYTMPPYITSTAELECICAAICSAIEEKKWKF